MSANAFPGEDRTAVPLWLLISSLCSMLLALFLIFVWVPTEATMGIVQRVFYFHVPAAAVSFTAAFAGGIASILYLVKRENRYDDFSLAANESAVLFGTVNVVMGSIWARRVWGIWWAWDAKLTSQFILLMIYWVYLVVRRATPPEQRGIVCAVISIMGMLDVPLVYLSNRIFRTQHPSPVIGGGEGSGLAPQMLVTLLASMFAMFMLWWCMIRLRKTVARLERGLDDAIRRTHQFADSEGL